MRQAFRILVKDIRRLRFELAVTLAVMAAFALSGWELPLLNARFGGIAGRVWRVGSLGLPFAWWVLIVRVMHAEALPGDRQFWITRPYRRTSLLAAKAMFIAAFVNLPLIAADVAILYRNGFDIAEILPGIAATQVLLTVFFVLPVAALSAVTSTLLDLLSVFLFGWVAFVAWNVAAPEATLGGSWHAVEWVKYGYAGLLILILSLVILIWQYARRRTAMTRMIAVAAVAAIIAGIALIPWTTAYTVQAHFSRLRIQDSSVDVSFDAGRPWLTHVLRLGGNRVQIEAPVLIGGIPPGMVAQPDGAAVTIEGEGGLTWRADDRPWTNVSTRWTVVSVRATLDAGLYEQIRQSPATVRGRLFLTLYGNRRTARIAFGEPPVPTPGIGVCSASHSGSADRDVLLCNSAFRPPSSLVSVRFRMPGRNEPLQPLSYAPLNPISYAPLPAGLSVVPLHQHMTSSWLRGPASWVTVDTLEPVAHICPRFEIAGVRFADLEAPTGAPVLRRTYNK